MSGLYRQGKVQALVERLLALALRFDDDGEVDVFLFGAEGHEAGTLDLSQRHRLHRRDARASSGSRAAPTTARR